MRNRASEQKSLHCFILAVAALTVLNWGAEHAFAQRATASVAGSIVDVSEAGVPGATVVVRNLDTSFERTVKTNDLGYYVVPAPPAGPYSISISKRGFQTRT